MLWRAMRPAPVQSIMQSSAPTSKCCSRVKPCGPASSPALANAAVRCFRYFAFCRSERWQLATAMTLAIAHREGAKSPGAGKGLQVGVTTRTSWSWYSMP